MKAKTNLDLTQATKLMVALSEVSTANIFIADTKQYGGYTLYIKKYLVSAPTLLKITEISEQHGYRVACSDSHYIII